MQRAGTTMAFWTLSPDPAAMKEHKNSMLVRDTTKNRWPHLKMAQRSGTSSATTWQTMTCWDGISKNWKCKQNLDDWRDDLSRASRFLPQEYFRKMFSSFEESLMLDRRARIHSSVCTRPLPTSRQPRLRRALNDHWYVGRRRWWWCRCCWSSVMMKRTTETKDGSKISRESREKDLATKEHQAIYLAHRMQSWVVDEIIWLLTNKRKDWVMITVT